MRKEKLSFVWRSALLWSAVLFFCAFRPSAMAEDAALRVTQQYRRAAYDIQTWVNDQGVPTNNEKGYAYEEQELNGRSKPTQVSYYDQNHALVNASDGYARIHNRFDGYGKLLSSYYEDKDGNRIVGPDGYAGVHRAYDGKGKLSQEIYFDQNAKMIEKPTKK